MSFNRPYHSSSSNLPPLKRKPNNPSGSGSLASPRPSASHSREQSPASSHGLSDSDTPRREPSSSRASGPIHAHSQSSASYSREASPAVIFKGRDPHHNHHHHHPRQHSPYPPSHAPSRPHSRDPSPAVGPIGPGSSGFRERERDRDRDYYSSGGERSGGEGGPRFRPAEYAPRLPSSMASSALHSHSHPHSRDHSPARSIGAPGGRDKEPPRGPRSHLASGSGGPSPIPLSVHERHHSHPPSFPSHPNQSVSHGSHPPSRHHSPHPLPHAHQPHPRDHSPAIHIPHPPPPPAYAAPSREPPVTSSLPPPPKLHASLPAKPVDCLIVPPQQASMPPIAPMKLDKEPPRQPRNFVSPSVAVPAVVPLQSTSSGGYFAPKSHQQPPSSHSSYPSASSPHPHPPHAGTPPFQPPPQLPYYPPTHSAGPPQHPYHSSHSSYQGSQAPPHPQHQQPPQSALYPYHPPGHSGPPPSSNHASSHPPPPSTSSSHPSSLTHSGFSQPSSSSLPLNPTLNSYVGPITKPSPVLTTTPETSPNIPLASLPPPKRAANAPRSPSRDRRTPKRGESTPRQPTRSPLLSPAFGTSPLPSSTAGLPSSPHLPRVSSFPSSSELTAASSAPQPPPPVDPTTDVPRPVPKIKLKLNPSINRALNKPPVAAPSNLLALFSSSSSSSSAGLATHANSTTSSKPNPLAPLPSIKKKSKFLPTFDGKPNEGHSSSSTTLSSSKWDPIPGENAFVAPEDALLSAGSSSRPKFHSISSTTAANSSRSTSPAHLPPSSVGPAPSSSSQSTSRPLASSSSTFADYKANSKDKVKAKTSTVQGSTDKYRDKEKEKDREKEKKKLGKSKHVDRSDGTLAVAKPKAMSSTLTGSSSSTHGAVMASSLTGSNKPKPKGALSGGGGGGAGGGAGGGGNSTGKPSKPTKPSPHRPSASSSSTTTNKPIYPKDDSASTNTTYDAHHLPLSTTATSTSLNRNTFKFSVDVSTDSDSLTSLPSEFQSSDSDSSHGQRGGNEDAPQGGVKEGEILLIDGLLDEDDPFNQPPKDPLALVYRAVAARKKRERRRGGEDGSSSDESESDDGAIRRGKRGRRGSDSDTDSSGDGDSSEEDSEEEDSESGFETTTDEGGKDGSDADDEDAEMLAEEEEILRKEGDDRERRQKARRERGWEGVRDGWGSGDEGEDFEDEEEEDDELLKDALAFGEDEGEGVLGMFASALGSASTGTHHSSHPHRDSHHHPRDPHHHHHHLHRRPEVKVLEFDESGAKVRGEWSEDSSDEDDVFGLGGGFDEGELWIDDTLGGDGNSGGNGGSGSRGGNGNSGGRRNGMLSEEETAALVGGLLDIQEMERDRKVALDIVGGNPSSGSASRQDSVVSSSGLDADDGDALSPPVIDADGSVVPPGLGDLLSLEVDTLDNLDLDYREGGGGTAGMLIVEDWDGRLIFGNEGLDAGEFEFATESEGDSDGRKDADRMEDLWDNEHDWDSSYSADQEYDGDTTDSLPEEEEEEPQEELLYALDTGLPTLSNTLPSVTKEAPSSPAGSHARSSPPNLSSHHSNLHHRHLLHLQHRPTLAQPSPLRLPARGRSSFTLDGPAGRGRLASPGLPHHSHRYHASTDEDEEPAVIEPSRLTLPATSGSPSTGSNVSPGGPSRKPATTAGSAKKVTPAKPAASTSSAPAVLPPLASVDPKPVPPVTSVSATVIRLRTKLNPAVSSTKDSAAPMASRSSALTTHKTPEPDPPAKKQRRLPMMGSFLPDLDEEVVASPGTALDQGDGESLLREERRKGVIVIDRDGRSVELGGPRRVGGEGGSGVGTDGGGSSEALGGDAASPARDGSRERGRGRSSRGGSVGSSLGLKRKSSTSSHSPFMPASAFKRLRHSLMPGPTHFSTSSSAPIAPSHQGSSSRSSRSSSAVPSATSSRSRSANASFSRTTSLSHLPSYSSRHHLRDMQQQQQQRDDSLPPAKIIPLEHLLDLSSHTGTGSGTSPNPTTSSTSTTNTSATTINESSSQASTTTTKQSLDDLAKLSRWDRIPIGTFRGRSAGEAKQFVSSSGHHVKPDDNHGRGADGARNGEGVFRKGKRPLVVSTGSSAGGGGGGGGASGSGNGGVRKPPMAISSSTSGGVPTMRSISRSRSQSRLVSPGFVPSEVGRDRTRPSLQGPSSSSTSSSFTSTMAAPFVGGGGDDRLGEDGEVEDSVAVKREKKRKRKESIVEDA